LPQCPPTSVILLVPRALPHAARPARRRGAAARSAHGPPECTTRLRLRPSFRGAASRLGARLLTAGLRRRSGPGFDKLAQRFARDPIKFPITVQLAQDVDERVRSNLPPRPQAAAS
jgi:hypothetical protein